MATKQHTLPYIPLLHPIADAELIEQLKAHGYKEASVPSRPWPTAVVLNRAQRRKGRRSH